MLCPADAVGYHFVERPEGATNGNFVGIGADTCLNHSVLVEQSQPFGVLISNGEVRSRLLVFIR